jgi:hypothetical protein
MLRVVNCLRERNCSLDAWARFAMRRLSLFLRAWAWRLGSDNHARQAPLSASDHAAGRPNSSRTLIYRGEDREAPRYGTTARMRMRRQ